MIEINEEFLKRAIEYANRALDISSESYYYDEDREDAIREAIDVGELVGTWQCLVRGYYDACVEMSAQKEVDEIPPARISDTERPPVRGEETLKCADCKVNDAVAYVFHRRFDGELYPAAYCKDHLVQEDQPLFKGSVIGCWTLDIEEAMRLPPEKTFDPQNPVRPR